MKVSPSSPVTQATFDAAYEGACKQMKELTLKDLILHEGRALNPAVTEQEAGRIAHRLEFYSPDKSYSKSLMLTVFREEISDFDRRGSSKTAK